MEISGINVSPGAMAFSCFLERLDGVINVLILFNVLRALGPAMKPTVSTDSEKGPSAPTYGWKSQSTYTSETQGPVTKTAPQRTRLTLSYKGGLHTSVP
ncbi:hypothetical protein BJV77DRAFT_714824 [Russula vinacea]|nr:hypothetical protein BJV77DRAFT_714824 [Russula vinacea]